MPLRLFLSLQNVHFLAQQERSFQDFQSTLCHNIFLFPLRDWKEQSRRENGLSPVRSDGSLLCAYLHTCVLLFLGCAGRLSILPFVKYFQLPTIVFLPLLGLMFYTC